MVKLPSFSRNLIYSALIIVLAACANVVAPTGGPEDEDPPVVLRSTPPNYSTYYEGQDVRIFFNEFVEIKDLRQNLLVSPPLQNDPEIRVRGRSVIMSVEDTLMENTTYNFFFGESIVDITEGNAIPNFQFVVSTGSYVDSLSVTGNVKNALTLEPEEDVFVMLYDDVFDSVPMLQRPVYLSKTDKEGNFFISNMREGEYLMFALKDVNTNYLYDNPDEMIGFIDSLIKPEFIEPLGREKEIAEADTLTGDSIEVTPLQQNDTITENPDVVSPADSLSDLQMTTDIHRYELFLFQEKDTLQRLMASTLTRKGRISFAFRAPVDSVHFTDYKEPLPENWNIKEYNRNRDTLAIWFSESERDSLFLKVYDHDRLLDTVNISLTVRAVRGRGTPQQEEGPVLNISTPTLKARKQPFFRSFELVSQTPVREFIPDSVQVFVSDSIPAEAEFEFADITKRRLHFKSFMEQDSTYLVRLLPGALTDIFGATNDTLSYSFRTTTREDYGYIMANITLPGIVEDDTLQIINDTIQDPEPQKQFLLQLLTEKFEIVDEKIISESDIYQFEYLPASTFRFRLVEDSNRNGMWDTGTYLDEVQPEKVYVFPDKIQSRLNWDVEVIWDISAQ
ncbi:MAG: Ig-like domain-containing protein [Bacteroidales bacterium]